MTDCEICRNHELCRLENKDKIKNCFYVYPNEEYLASQTKEYKLGYNKAIDDFVNFANTCPEIEEEEYFRGMSLEEMAEKLKEGGENENYNKEES